MPITTTIHGVTIVKAKYHGHQPQQARYIDLTIIAGKNEMELTIFARTDDVARRLELLAKAIGELFPQRDEESAI